MGSVVASHEATEAQVYLTGKKPDQAALVEAARRAAAASPSADRRGQVDYKTEMARVLTLRALRLAVTRAEGK